MPVVVQVGELVTPLGDDAQGILEEGDDDEETANGRDVTRWPSQQLQEASSAKSELTA